MDVQYLCILWVLLLSAINVFASFCNVKTPIVCCRSGCLLVIAERCASSTSASAGEYYLVLKSQSPEKFTKASIILPHPTPSFYRLRKNVHFLPINIFVDYSIHPLVSVRPGSLSNEAVFLQTSPDDGSAKRGRIFFVCFTENRLLVDHPRPRLYITSLENTRIIVSIRIPLIDKYPDVFLELLPGRSVIHDLDVELNLAGSDTEDKGNRSDAYCFGREQF